jgi:two-component system response regulator DesR
VDPDIAASALTEDDCPLSDREPQVLRAARTGASVAEIATEVHPAQSTVRNYLSPRCPNWAPPPSPTLGSARAGTPIAAAHHARQQGWI